MWCPSYSPNYFSLADILATEERVPLVTKTELPQLGFLDAVSLDLGLSTRVLYQIYQRRQSPILCNLWG